MSTPSEVVATMALAQMDLHEGCTPENGRYASSVQQQTSNGSVPSDPCRDSRYLTNDPKRQAPPLCSQSDMKPRAKPLATAYLVINR